MYEVHHFVGKFLRRDELDRASFSFQREKRQNLYILCIWVNMMQQHRHRPVLLLLFTTHIDYRVMYVHMSWSKKA